MTTGVGMEMSRERNAFPRCHASSALKWERTRDASILAIVSSYMMEQGISYLGLEMMTGETYISWRRRNWPHHLRHAEISALCSMLRARV